MSFNKQTMLFNKQTMSLSLKCKINRSYFPIRLFSCTNWVRINNTNPQVSNDNKASYVFTNIEKILDQNPINRNTQIEIEKFLHNQCMHILEDINVLGVNINYLNSNIKTYCYEKSELIKVYLNKYSKESNQKYLASLINSKSKTKNYDYFSIKIINTLDKNETINIMLYIFLKIVTYCDINSDKELYNSTTNNYILLGKLLVNKYINKIKDKDISFSQFKKQFIENDAKNSYLFESDFYLHLGGKLTLIMIEAGLLEHSSVMYKENNHSVLKIPKEIINFIPLNSVITSPINLPMIVEPKPYSKDLLGGYLLNDDLYEDRLMNTKVGMKEISTIDENNIIYHSLNNMQKTAFKINRKLLEYLLYHNNEHNLLTIPEESIYKNIDNTKMSSKEKASYQQYLSKKLLYDHIIKIASAYKNVPEIFFPLKMDFRGRLYPISVYFHYQSCELAKALLIFARPDTIKRADNISIEYLKAYGATCFGNGLDKKNYSKRLEWINNN